MSKYETPIQITYGWACPYHGYHQKSTLLATNPRANQVIGLTFCSSPFPASNEPLLTTKLYGNLKLVTSQPKLKKAGKV